MKLTTEDAEKTQSKQRKILAFSLFSLFSLCFSLWFLYLVLIANEIYRRGRGEGTENAEEKY